MDKNTSDGQEERFKAIIVSQNRITIPEPVRIARNLKEGDLLQVGIKKIK